MSSTKELGLALRTLIDNNIVSNANQKDQLRIVHGFVTGVNKKEGTSPTINFSSMDGTIKIDEISVLPFRSRRRELMEILPKIPMLQSYGMLEPETLSFWLFPILILTRSTRQRKCLLG